MTFFEKLVTILAWPIITVVIFVIMMAAWFVLPFIELHVNERNPNVP